ncbi:sulfur carrier protein ThiS adenylyltransferase ThiF [bacterium]|nr:sulfur carrier protein ThiS adenylyltransferase ThiF [candidate division CSSED10-310 bacterium]
MTGILQETDSGLYACNVPGTTGRLRRACVGIIGCGGLGSNAAVALVRAGIGRLILADFDTVALSNLNRQHYFLPDVGKHKVTALAEHLRAIDPTVHLDLHPVEVTSESLNDVFNPVDVLIEAVDRAETKHALIHAWHRLHPDIPMIVGNGIAGYGNTDTIQVIRTGTIIYCGDMISESRDGLASPRVLIVAAMQANVALELLLEGNQS